MNFSRLSYYFDRLETTSKRLEMFSILADLFKETTPDEIDQVIYLLKGELLPPFHGVNIGMAEKYILRAIADAGRIDSSELLKTYHQIGDIGKTAEQSIGVRIQSKEQTVSEVYREITALAGMSGEGSVDRKVAALSALLTALTPVEAKFVARFVAGQLRLGVGDATILEALALSKGDRADRVFLDRAYHLTSDLGLVAKIFFESGKEAIMALSVRLGYPIRPALCERLPTMGDH